MRNTSGFTLIEVIVAITLIGVISATVVGVLGAQASRSGEAIIAAQSLSFARTYVERIRKQPYAAIGSFNDVGAKDSAGTLIPGAANFNVGVAVAIGNWGVPAVPGKIVTVTVTDPLARTTTLTQFVTNHP
jgi:prepilin-type N-terminal cleavage/methylation domain-containing protein